MPAARSERRIWSRFFRIGGTLALLVGLVSGQSVFAQITTQTIDLVGPVESVLEYREYPGTTERQLLQTWQFTSEGTAQERVWFTYNFMDGSVRSRQVTTYDERGVPLVALTEDPDGEPMGQTVYRYDGAGRMVEQVSFDAEGTETRRVVYERDPDGNAVSEEHWVQGTLGRRYERDFDAQGRLVEQREFAVDRLTEVRTYIEPGRVAEFIEYDEEGDVETTGTLVDSEHGTEEWTFFDAEGNPTSGLFWTYAEDGLVQERRELDSDGREIVYAYAYEFDDRGNWVRQEISESIAGSASVYEIREREITYH